MRPMTVGPRQLGSFANPWVGFGDFPNGKLTILASEAERAQG